LSRSVFAIGDVHGCNAELIELLSRLPLRKDSLLVFLGDYIDRGPQSKGVVDTILSLRESYDVVTLMGNHEALLLDFLDDPSSAGAGVFILNGGSATLASYQTRPGHFEIPHAHQKFFRELKPVYETDEYFFVHAGVPNMPLKELDLERDLEDFLWIRMPFLNSDFRWEKMIVHGHTPVMEPEFKRNRINVDTGCVYNGHLSAVEFPQKKLYSVRRHPTEQTYLRGQGISSTLATRFQGALSVFTSKAGRGLEFETLNYNQFGLLMRQRTAEATQAEKPAAVFDVGDVIKGKIGVGSPGDVEFMGRIVRTESRGEGHLYGVQITSLSTPGDEMGRKI